jgi:hypothetical protein
MRTGSGVVAAFLLLVISAAIGNAQELAIGHLETSDDTGINWLNFNCNQNASRLSCEVFQTLIMHKVEGSNRDSEVQKQMTGNVVQDFQNAFGETCKNIDQLTEMIRKTVETGIGMDGRKVNREQALDGKAYFDNLADACRHTDLKTVRKFVETNIDKDVHTCRVVNSHSHIDFSYEPSTKTWVSNEGPSGVCGSITAGILEKDPKSKSNFWLYTEKVIRTIPGGILSNGLSCSNFPDRTMHYTWRAASNFLQCTYIENAM